MKRMLDTDHDPETGDTYTYFEYVPVTKTLKTRIKIDDSFLEETLEREIFFIDDATSKDGMWTEEALLKSLVKFLKKSLKKSYYKITLSSPDNYHDMITDSDFTKRVRKLMTYSVADLKPIYEVLAYKGTSFTIHRGVWENYVGEKFNAETLKRYFDSGTQLLLTYEKSDDAPSSIYSGKIEKLFKDYMVVRTHKGYRKFTYEKLGYLYEASMFQDYRIFPIYKLKFIVKPALKGEYAELTVEVIEDH